MTDRRTFITGAAAAVVAMAASGCRSLAGRCSFYGPTVRDRLWMWGHHSEMCHKSVKKGKQWPGPTVEQAEGCRLMGIPNVCVIRWGDRPKHPWGDYFDQFKSMKRVSFGIVDGASGSVWDKLNIAINELKPAMPNLTGCFLDDFFEPTQKLTLPLSDMAKVSDTVHENGLRLSVVLYADQEGVKKEFKRHLDFCDETSFWFWKSSSIVTMRDNVRRCRDLIGPDKDLLLGLYMWDYTLGAPVPADRMEQQLENATSFLADGTVSGLIFHPTYAAALDAPAVNLAKEWIRAHGDDRWSC